MDDGLHSSGMLDAVRCTKEHQALVQDAISMLPFTTYQAFRWNEKES